MQKNKSFTTNGFYLWAIIRSAFQDLAVVEIVETHKPTMYYDPPPTL